MGCSPPHYVEHRLTVMFSVTVRVVVIVVCMSGAPAHGALKLASYYSDHMVLQRGPQRAVLWGTADTEGDTVTAQVTGQGSAVTTTVHNGSWKLKLPAITDPGPFVIDVRSGDGQVTLNDVLFGDVWLCSGQSNMKLEMSKVMNSAEEIQTGVGFQTIRFMKTAKIKSDTPMTTLNIEQQWTAPTTDTLNDFSAVCFLFAEYLQPHLNYPIGLVGSYWGGTTIEAWSPPEAVQACPVVDHGPEKKCCPHAPEVLWNSKIYPLRAMTLTGVLWYQGEANLDQAEQYACQMRAMVAQWRPQFHLQSLGETKADFPFGYVQLGAFKNTRGVGNFPVLRWSQTVNHGYSPNTDLPNTFMAVAMDLPDFNSPYGPIHSRYKVDVARRLVPGALHVAYGQQDVQFQGPFPSGFSLDAAAHTVTITFSSGTAHLEIRKSRGFEVCCAFRRRLGCSLRTNLVAAPIIGHNQSHVTIDISRCRGDLPVGVRYAWRTTPCFYKKCPVYDTVTGLPAPPFYLGGLNFTSTQSG